MNKAGRYLSEFFKGVKRSVYNTEFDRHQAKLKAIGCALPGPCVAWRHGDKLRLQNSFMASVANIYDLSRLQEPAVIQDRMNRGMWFQRKRPDYKDKKHGCRPISLAPMR